MTKSEKVPVLGIFSPKTIFMFRVGLKKLGLVGNGTTQTFHLSLMPKSEQFHAKMHFQSNLAP